MRSRSAVVDPLIVGVLAAAVSLVGAGRPSFWYDEAATISASYSRSIGQLWQMLTNVDAVHGLYYLLMHGWFTLFPPTEFWSRVPSGLAVGGAAAGVVVLGRQFSSRTVAVSSGVICAILPRATWAGIEARPYALSMMAAAWVTVLLVHAARRDNGWLWLSYGLVLAAVDSARRVPRADGVGACRFPLFLPEWPISVSCGSRITSVCSRVVRWRRLSGRPSVKCIRSSGSHRLGARRSKTWRFSSTSREARCSLLVSACDRGDGYHLVALHIYATRAGGPAAV